jgi:hypothetical protein
MGNGQTWRRVTAARTHHTPVSNPKRAKLNISFVFPTNVLHNNMNRSLAQQLANCLRVVVT